MKILNETPTRPHVSVYGQFLLISKGIRSRSNSFAHRTEAGRVFGQSLAL